jgi:hypothetical protein
MKLNFDRIENSNNFIHFFKDILVNNAKNVEQNWGTSWAMIMLEKL